MSFWATVGEKLRNGWAVAREWRVVAWTVDVADAVRAWWTGNERVVLDPRSFEPVDDLPENGLEPLAPPPPAAAQPAANGARPQVPPRRAPGLSLCIDLGTFASTVARERDGNVEVAVLNFVGDGSGGWTAAYESRSAVLWIDDQPFMDSETFEVMSQNHPDAEVTRSFKRLLFEYVWFERDKRNSDRLMAMYEELLLLALDPEKSSTVRLLEAAMSAGRDIAGRGFDPERVRKWKLRGGLPNLALGDDGRPRAERDRLREDRERLLLESVMAGARLRLCVPNSFDAQSVNVAKGRLGAAFAAAVRKMFPAFANQVPPPDVSIIREAEAVTWCIDNPENDAEQVLVLDIGAGTTDAALVQIGRRGARRGRHVLSRTGMPFGGDDVDLIFLSTLYARNGGLTPLENMPREAKLHLSGVARMSKEGWSGQRTLQPDEIEFLRTALANPAGEPLPEHEFATPVGLLIPLQTRDRDESIELGNPLQIAAFVDFLRLTVLATCEPLLQKATGPITRVLLSGAASYTPGVEVALQTVLEKYRCTAEIERAADLLTRKPRLVQVPAVRRAKLACVYGGTSSLPLSSTFDRDFLPESIRIEIHTPVSRREYDLFPAGERLHEGRLLAFYSTDVGDEYVVNIYRYFTPHEFIDEQYRGSDWVRRFIARGQFLETAKLVFELTENQEGVSDFAAWSANTALRNQLMPLTLISATEQQRTTEMSPLTGLPLEWLWGENDV
jgi:hypothetical protein